MNFKAPTAALHAKNLIFLRQDLALILNTCTDGTARIILHYIFWDLPQIYRVWFVPTTLDPREEKFIWMKQGSKPGPLALQATAQSIAPWLLG